MKAATSIFWCIAAIGVIFLLSQCRFEDNPEDVVYGPVSQEYKVPEVPGRVYFVAPDGDADADGISPDNPTTLEDAIIRVVSGDAIVLRGGVYRTGDLVFNQGITIQAYRDEQPILNGTLVADAWIAYNDSIWVTDWEYLFPAGPEDWWARAWNERYTPMHRFNNDAVFIDGQYLQSAGSIEELNEETFFVDYDNHKIYIAANPEDRFIEITAFRKALYRPIGPAHGKNPDNRGPVIRGITFTQYPDTMVHIGRSELAIDQHGRDVVGTVLENCVFSNCFRIGVYAFSDSLVMRNCKVFNTNTEGVYVVASNDILLERNIFENNNIERWTGFYPAAVKIFNQSHRAVVRQNLVINHPHSNGVWWDVGNHDGVFVNNHVEKVSQNGYFFEISKGAIVAGNVFVDCGQSIFVLNASHVEVYNNTLINSRVSFSRDNRGDQLGVFGWHVTLGPGVEERHGHTFVNNLMYMDADHDSPFLQTTQPPFMCDRLSLPHLTTLNNNVYVRGVGEKNHEAPIIRWSPYAAGENCQLPVQELKELSEMYPEFETNGMFLGNFTDTLFPGMAEKSFRPVEEFEGIDAAAIPGHITAAMGLKENPKPFIGAVAPW